MKKFDQDKFCSDLKGLRSSSNQKEVAKELGINRSTLSLLETGKQIPSLEILAKFCDFGKFQTNDYFFDTENDGLIYLMGSLEKSDIEKINEMLENIKIKDKYEIISRKCN